MLFVLQNLLKMYNKHIKLGWHFWWNWWWYDENGKGKKSKSVLLKRNSLRVKIDDDEMIMIIKIIKYKFVNFVIAKKQQMKLKCVQAVILIDFIL